jgi:iron complex transport system ATP-binding protein
MSVIFEFKNATVQRERRTILDAVTLSIRAGEHTAIIGPNGAGKTTLMKLMTGDARALFREEHPPVKIFGQENYSVWDIKKRMGIITNDLHEKFKMNGGYMEGVEVILSGLHDTIGFLRTDDIEDKDIESAKKLIDMLGIEYLYDQKFQDMSSGEARKTLIARALITEPDVLMLDEPTTGLDITAQFGFYDLMKKMANMKHTMIMISHHIEEITPDIQYIVMLKGGKIFAKGQKEQILTTENVSDLFGVPIEVHKSRNGIYHFIR